MCEEEAEETTTTTARRTTTTSTTTTTLPSTTSALTGEPVDDAVLARPVVAVKYDNVQGRSTPQVGIGAADVVYEIQVEGAVTRLLALFQSEDAAPVGPVRSARGSEVGLLEELNAPLFAWHGANAILRQEVRNSAIVPRSIDDVPQLYYRERGRPAPYNSFIDGTAAIRDTAPEGSTGPPEAILTFASTPDQPPSAAALPATFVDVVFTGGAGGAPVRYEWDAGLGKWRRFQGGVPHVDGDGNQLAVENVIVRFVQAVDSGTVDKAGAFVPTAVVTGEGEAWVFSQGTVTTGTWSKPDNLSRTTYRDQNGDEIVLTPGTTWISMPYTAASSGFG